MVVSTQIKIGFGAWSLVNNVSIQMRSQQAICFCGCTARTRWTQYLDKLNLWNFSRLRMGFWSRRRSKNILIPGKLYWEQNWYFKMVNNESRGYKIRIIDPSWEMLGKPIYALADQKWHDLDNKRVEFPTSFSRHHFGPSKMSTSTTTFKSFDISGSKVWTT